MIEYWSPEPPFALPDNLDFELKSQTDLYEFRKVKKRMCQWMCIDIDVEKISTHLPHFFS